MLHTCNIYDNNLIYLNEEELSINGISIKLPIGRYSRPKLFNVNGSLFVGITDLNEGNLYLFKENAELVERTFGEAKKDDNEVKVNFELPQKDPITLPNDVIFPHQFLVDVLNDMVNGEQMLVKKVYEGTIPDKFFDISVFFTKETFKEENKALPGSVDKNFFKIRLVMKTYMLS